MLGRPVPSSTHSGPSPPSARPGGFAKGEVRLQSLRIEGSTHGVYRGLSKERQANFTLPGAAERMKNNVRTLRLDRGLSQAEFARQLGISRQSVHSIETGRFDPSLPLAFRIAALLEAPIEEVFDKPVP